MLLITNKIPKSEINIHAAFENFEAGRGIIAQVYENQVSLLTRDFTEGLNKEFVSFHKFTGKYNINFATGGETREKAIANIKQRIIEDGSVMNYYYFENLQEFAAAIIENNWN